MKFWHVKLGQRSLLSNLNQPFFNGEKMKRKENDNRNFYFPGSLWILRDKVSERVFIGQKENLEERGFEKP